MRFLRWRSVPLLLLATVFSVGLAWAALELPRAASAWLIGTIDFPAYDSGRQMEDTEAFLQSHGIRWIGYASLALILALILAGFIAEKRGLAAAGFADERELRSALSYTGPLYSKLGSPKAVCTRSVRLVCRFSQVPGARRPREGSPTPSALRQVP